MVLFVNGEVNLNFIVILLVNINFLDKLEIVGIIWFVLLVVLRLMIVKFCVFVIILNVLRVYVVGVGIFVILVFIVELDEYGKDILLNIGLISLFFLNSFMFGCIVFMVRVFGLLFLILLFISKLII